MRLDGVRVVSLTHYLQGPACVQYLADLGADVVKVERAGGAYERHWSGAQAFSGDVSVFFLATGRNQRSIELDFRTESGKEILTRLISQADVLVENFRPGVLERYGFGYDDLAARFPRLIYCSLSGFGSTGPLAHRPGQDLLVQAETGFMWLSGRDEDPPIPAGTALVDQHAAALGALGVCAALLGRERTGRGGKVDSNLFSAALDLQIEPLNYHLNSHLYERSASGISTRFHQAPYGVFQTADGWLTVSLTDGPTLAAALDEPALADFTKQDQFTQREEVNELVAAALQRRTTDQWREVLEAAEIWHAPVSTYEELESHPQLTANESIVNLTSDGQSARILAHPIRFDGEVPPVRRQPPSLGEHTDEVLRELG